MQIQSRLITIILSLIISFIFPITSLSETLLRTQNTIGNKEKQMLELTGNSRIKIEDKLQGAIFGSESINKLFNGAGWMFKPDGTFTFTPQSGEPISGTYIKVGENLQFQGERIKNNKILASIDGTVYLNKDELVLDVLYSHLTLFQQTFRISQVLSKGQSSQYTPPVLPSEDVIPPEIAILDNKIQQELNALGINQDLLLTEIAGIKLDQFKVTITGKTDKGNFGPLDATIFISAPPSDSQNTLSFTLITNPDLLGINGWINVSSEDLGKVAVNTQVQASDGKISVELAPVTTGFRSATYTLGKDTPNSDFNRQVLIESGTLNFTVEGDRLLGNIKLSGVHLPGVSENFSDFKESSTYEAQVVGQIPKSSPVEKLKASLASNFNGVWNTNSSRFGTIELQQKGQKVTGIYTGSSGGFITGNIIGNRINFTWKDNNNISKGTGFLRAIPNGGQLVGIWAEESEKFSEKSPTIMAVWQLPENIDMAKFSAFDKQELRYLGQELAIEGKCVPAVSIFKPVINSYLPSSGLSTSSSQLDLEKEQEKESNAISAAMALNYLINCYFRLGEYEPLLTSLDQGLEIQRFLGPDQSASRLFRQLTGNISKPLSSNIETLQVIEGGYKLGEQIFSGKLGFVGISLGQDQETKLFIVNALEPNKPASLAGILPQDIILKIDNKPTEGMSESQVSESLRGKPGTSVNVTIRRDNQTLDFQLIRDKATINSPKRQLQITETLQFFAESAQDLRETSQNLLAQINTDANKIALGQEDPVLSLLKTREFTQTQVNQFAQETDIMIARGKEVFQAQDQALQELEILFSSLKNFNPSVGIPLEDLDRHEQRMYALIDNDTSLSSLEKQVFRQYFAGVIFRLNFLFEIKTAINLIDRIDARQLFQTNRQRSLEMTSGLTDRIESWRTRLVEDFDKIEALDQGQYLFGKAISYLISLKYQNDALVISEKSRARAFADLLEKRLSSPLEISQTKPPSLEIIQKIAQEKKATLVEYYLVESRLYIWVVKPSGTIDLEKVDLPKTLNNSLESLVINTRQSLGVRGRKFSIVAEPIVDTEEQKTKLQQLNQILIAPIAHLLPKDPNAHVIFIPQGELFLVPFAALQDAQGKYLIQKHTILTAPSIQILDLTQQQQQQQRKQTNPQELVIVGNPTMPQISPIITEKLSPLPGAEKEAVAIAQLLQTSPLIGNAATKTAILAKLPQARIVHFATHGLLDDFQGLGIPGAIALADDGNDSGLLTAQEIFGLQLQAELVVLSACDTGRGRITGGWSDWFISLFNQCRGA